MRALDRKVMRDLKRLWAQAVAIALVIASGVATLLLAVGAYQSLDETRIAYYERNAFADVFAQVRRAPKTLVRQIAEIPGVGAAEPRIEQFALLDIPNFPEPATGELISLPESGEPLLNRPYMRLGRMPDPASQNEIVINEAFANAHGFAPGSRFSAIMNGRKRELLIVGVALSPEFVYAVGPGDIMPDNRRFGVIWMPERALAGAYNLRDSFSSVSLKLLPSASEPEVIRRVDALLERYGGQAAYGRKDQRSNAWLDHALEMFKNMGRVLPPIFMLVSAFLINLTLGRLVALEREQVGLLKALGYSNFQVAAHYLKFVLLIASFGIAIGSAVGTVLGRYVLGIYGDIFRFPFLLFTQSPSIYVIAGAFSLAAAALGAARALREIVKLAPAVAMQPPAPSRFRQILPPRFSLDRIVSQPAVMMLRNMTRHPLRTSFTLLGVAMATGILVLSFGINDIMNNLVDVTYFMADRQDATVSFVERRPQNVVYKMASLPGVIAAEPRREVPIRIRKGAVDRRVMLSGRRRGADLNRIIDVNLRPVVLPESGLAISGWLAQILGVNVGDEVEVDLLEGQRRTVTLTVAARVEDYFGLRAMMDADALAQLMREAPAVNSVSLAVDGSQYDSLYRAIKAMPTVSAMALQRDSLATYRAVIAIVATAIGGIYSVLGIVIAFGVVYNNARISLSENARELASLRVLGFTNGEVLRMLLLELAVITTIAQPPGWAVGYGLGWIMTKRLAGEIMRVRLNIEHFTYASASMVVIVAALFSALIVGRRVFRLDLVSVLKTRD